ncbi:Rib/alpha-like domain-containing protein [uncultured Corynebacterium sp.]|uniref:Rib/alpha-like domain-containing protein n=1 Tax=uncultured Corynebacterium sp. TaxID=159447 RepID=UPI0025CE084D|nr:Rib/alpha-like domain-containing protein [uncultured Corynebacterium sp.]
MMFLRSRRTMTAVAAAASLVLTATAVPNSPFSPVAAQAATANKTQDTSLDYRCNVFAGGGIGNVNYDLSTGFHVTMPESVSAGEEVDVTVKIDSLQINNEQAGSVGGQPSFEEGNTKGNRIRFHIPEDVELVDSNLNATLNNHVLDVNGMMQPSKKGSLVTIAFKELKLKLKPKKAGTVTLQTPKKFPKLDDKGRVVHSNMVWGQGIAGKVLWKTPGLKVTCMTDQYKPLGATEVKPYSDALEPKYSNVTVKQQDAATAKNSAQAPAGTTYAKGANAPEWATVAKDGTVTVKPGLDVKPGDYTVPVVVTYPDSSADNAVVNVTVKEKPLAEQHDPQYADVTVKQLDEETVEAPKDIAEGATFAAGENAPDWATVAEDGTVTVKPSREVKPGDYTVPVVVSYPDESKGDTVVNVHVKVTHTNELHDPQFGETTVEQESTSTIPAPEGLPEGAKVTRGEGAPEWITVNEDGSIEAKPTLETEDKEYTVPVVVTYDDKSTDEATAKVTVTKKPDNQVYSPEFGSITVQANRSAKTPAIEGMPDGTTFALAEGAPDWASIDDKGAVQLNPGGEVDAKDYTVPVIVTYPDGTTDNAELKVTVTERAINELHDPTYEPIEVKQEETATVAAPKDSAADAEYSLGAGAPSWVTLNKDGSLEARPNRNVEPGEYQIPVTVIYGDDSADRTTAVVTVTVKPANEIHDPTYSDVTVKQGDEVTAPAPTDVAEGATFEAGEGVPSWITVNPDGTVTAKPGLEVEAKEYTVPVKVSYEDGSGDDTTVNITVTVKPTNEKYNPTYPDADVKQGDETTVAPPADVADGAEFALGEGAPEWATVNEDGTVTLKPSKEVKPGDYDVPVVITYPDKSTTTTTLKVTIEEQDKQNDNTGSTGSGDGLFGSLKGSSSVSGSSAFGYFIAALFGTIAIGAGLFGLYNWARDHGYVR